MKIARAALFGIKIYIQAAGRSNRKSLTSMYKIRHIL